jgi:hypothetical protein
VRCTKILEMLLYMEFRVFLGKTRGLEGRGTNPPAVSSSLKYLAFACMRMFAGVLWHAGSISRQGQNEEHSEEELRSRTRRYR